MPFFSAFYLQQHKKMLYNKCMDIIEEKLKSLPDASGVYIMLDSNKKIIYIGKAKVLKNRVRQYFHSPVSFNDKTLAMVKSISDFNYIITNSEADAFALEANLIKKYKPRYNILLKDDKRYPYITVNLKEKFPAFKITRKIKKDGSKYFGPYMGGVRAGELLQIIGDAYPLKLCGLNLHKIPKSHRPCLNYHIGKCCAPCYGSVTKEQYKKHIDAACEFLKGNYKAIKIALTEKMQALSENEQYESAAGIRDKLIMIDKMNVDKVAAMPKKVDIDVFAYHTDGKFGAVSMLVVREGNMSGVKSFAVSDAGLYAGDTLTSFVTQYYTREIPPSEIIVTEKEGIDALADYLSTTYKKNIIVSVPVKGAKKNLADMAVKNAEEYLYKYIEKIKHKEISESVPAQLAESLGLKILPHKIECYDISHISGTDTAASMVVFIGGEKQSALYRRFKIKTVEGNNDFASMAEVIKRRLEKYAENTEDISFGVLPDLIVIDGGAGQLKAAVNILQKFDTDTQIISLAKREEEIYTLNRKEPVRLPLSSLSVRLLQKIRDEAHRFALSYHRKLREKRVASELENIEGIGENKIKELIKQFGFTENIKKASIEDISKTRGISETLAKRIYDYFNNQN